MTGCVVWITGLPASGKSTFAGHAKQRLSAASIPVCVLDGDEVRANLVPAPGYGALERDQFYATLGNLACLLARQGLVVLVPATAHRHRYRQVAERNAPRFLLVHVAAGADECRERDVKGLYRGNTVDLPGVGVDYEEPVSAAVVASGGHDEDALDELIKRFV